MKSIPLSQGKFALVDDGDYEALRIHRWSLSHGYAARKVNGRQLFMHRAILNPPPGQKIDHRNGDGLDNQRSNLRLATQAQNSQNQGKQSGTSSQFRGVTFHRPSQKWTAQIRVNGKLEYLGTFASEADAARHYDDRAAEAWGEYARLNFPAGLGTEQLAS